jgi:hypothetical protein
LFEKTAAKGDDEVNFEKILDCSLLTMTSADSNSFESDTMFEGNSSGLEALSVWMKTGADVEGLIEV